MTDIKTATAEELIEEAVIAMQTAISPDNRAGQYAYQVGYLRLTIQQLIKERDRLNAVIEANQDDHPCK